MEENNIQEETQTIDETSAAVLNEQSETAEDVSMQSEQESAKVDPEVIRQILREELDKWNREQQSLRAKLKNKITKEVESKIEALKIAGINPTDQHINAIRESVERQFIEAYDEEEGGEPARAQAAAQEQQQIIPLQAIVLSMMEREGIVLYENDPEMSIVKFDAQDEAEFLSSVKKAIEAKKDRGNKKKPVGNPAAVPAITARGGASGDLVEQYKKEMIAARGQGYLVGRAIKEKYRKLGLPVDDIGFTI